MSTTSIAVGVPRQTATAEFLRQNRSLCMGTALLALLIAMGGLLVEGFLSVQNARSILLLAAFLGLASVGQTLVALLGGLDLSIPFVIGSANILLPRLLRHHVATTLLMKRVTRCCLIHAGARCQALKAVHVISYWVFWTWPTPLH